MCVCVCVFVCVSVCECVCVCVLRLTTLTTHVFYSADVSINRCYNDFTINLF